MYIGFHVKYLLFLSDLLLASVTIILNDSVKLMLDSRNNTVD